MKRGVVAETLCVASDEIEEVLVALRTTRRWA